MRHLKSAREVVDVLGGIPAVCKMTRANIKAAYYWTGQAGMFPARTHWLMTKELKKRKCTAPPHLWNQLGASPPSKEAA